jgi:hypothetical protein
MANTTISALPSATTPLSGTEVVPIVQSGVTKKVAASDIAVSGGVKSFQTSLSGLTPSTATAGVVTLAGTLGTASGGTGLTSFTANGVVYASSSSALTTGSALTFDGTNFEVDSGVTFSRAIVLSSDAGGNAFVTAQGANGIDYNTDLVFRSRSVNLVGSFIWQSGLAGSYSEQMRLTSTGLGIGTTAIRAKLVVNEYTNTSYTELVAFTGAKGLFVGIPTNQLAIVDSTAQAAGVGGEISFEGKYNSTDTTSFAAVGGVKENSTSSDYGGAFIVKTRLNGGNLIERMRLDSSGNLGIGTSSPNASSILDVQSTTKGVRMPNMTTTQKNAIASPAAGLMVFDTTLAKLCVYSGSAWQTITSV